MIGRAPGNKIGLVKKSQIHGESWKEDLGP